MLSPMNAPLAAQTITNGIHKLPSPALTPPMITSVSLGTIGSTESSTAITKMIA